jgi:hypothetical protein
MKDNVRYAVFTLLPKKRVFIMYNTNSSSSSAKLKKDMES